MQKVQRKQKNEDVEKMVMLVARLSQYHDEYYNKAEPAVSDAVYDRLFEELQELKKRTGIVLSNSPTQTEDLLQMEGKAASLLMLKLDGLTVSLWRHLQEGTGILGRWSLTISPLFIMYRQEYRIKNGWSLRGKD